MKKKNKKNKSKKPAWDDSTSDLAAHKLSQTEMLRKKISLRSKHNVIYTPQQALRERKQKNKLKMQQLEQQRSAEVTPVKPKHTPTKARLRDNNNNNNHNVNLSFEEQKLLEGAKEFNQVLRRHGVFGDDVQNDEKRAPVITLQVVSLEDEIEEFENRRIMELEQHQSRRNNNRKTTKKFGTKTNRSQRHSHQSRQKPQQPRAKRRPQSAQRVEVTEPGILSETTNTRTTPNNLRRRSPVSNSLDLILAEPTEDVDQTNPAQQPASSTRSTTSQPSATANTTTTPGTAAASLPGMQASLRSLEDITVGGALPSNNHAFAQMLGLCKQMYEQLTVQSRDIESCRRSNAQLHNRVCTLEASEAALKRQVEYLQLKKNLLLVSGRSPPKVEAAEKEDVNVSLNTDEKFKATAADTTPELIVERPRKAETFVEETFSTPVKMPLSLTVSQSRSRSPSPPPPVLTERGSSLDVEVPSTANKDTAPIAPELNGVLDDDEFDTASQAHSVVTNDDTELVFDVTKQFSA